jgi:hypothetical protein
MNRIPMSSAGAGLLRALLARGGTTREQVRLVSYRASDWGSLTFEGERHELVLRLAGTDRSATTALMLDGLDEHEFELCGQIVADITAHITQTTDVDRAIEVRIEALTVGA